MFDQKLVHLRPRRPCDPVDDPWFTEKPEDLTKSNSADCRQPWKDRSAFLANPAIRGRQQMI